MCYNFTTALEDAWTSFFRKGVRTTMDRYVHVTDESLSKAILLFQNPDSEHTA